MHEEVETKIVKMMRIEEEHFEKILRTEVTPVIRGEITKGKLRWRGLSIVQSHIGFETIKQLVQRGIPVGKAFKFSLSNSL